MTDCVLEISPVPDRHWTAARTRSRCEKVVARYCDRHGIPAYLPVRRRAKRYQRRTVETFLPMFPGYLFVQIDETRKSLLMQSHRVVWTAAVDDPREQALVTELRSIRLLEQQAAEEDLIVRPELVAGKPVRVTAGPFQGLNGVVERRMNRTRLAINVELLGHSVSVDLDVEELQLDEV